MTWQGPAGQSEGKEGDVPAMETRVCHQDAIWICREGIRKAKAQMDLNLTRDVRIPSCCFYRYSGQKRQAKKRAYLLW